MKEEGFYNHKLEDETFNLLKENGFHIMKMQLSPSYKGVIFALQKSCVPGTYLKKLILLNTEYIDNVYLTKKDLNDTLKAGINKYLDSDEYKNKKDYYAPIKKIKK